MQNNDALVVPFFKTVAVEDAIASKRAGRPIFKDQEVVEIRIAGDRNFAPTYPAKSMWKRVEGDEMTYADRWPDAYARFKQGQEQVAHGTPLSELPFLTEARRQELRMLKVYTAEALASLDGKNLTNLGPQGREMKDQAASYLDRARGVAQDVALREELAEVKAKLAEFQGQKAPAPDQDERESLKTLIAEKTGSRPRGNPSVDTLRDMLAELEA